MKRIASISFVLLMLLYSTNNFWMSLAFTLNQKEIATSHCENKAKPKLHCDGKCHLKKEIKKENDEQTPTNYAKEKFEVLFFDEFQKVLKSIGASKKGNRFVYKIAQYTEPSYSIIHPPA